MPHGRDACGSAAQPRERSRVHRARGARCVAGHEVRHSLPNEKASSAKRWHRLAVPVPRFGQHQSARSRASERFRHERNTLLSLRTFAFLRIVDDPRSTRTAPASGWQSKPVSRIDCRSVHGARPGNNDRARRCCGAGLQHDVSTLRAGAHHMTRPQNQRHRSDHRRHASRRHAIAPTCAIPPRCDPGSIGAVANPGSQAVGPGTCDVRHLPAILLAPAGHRPLRASLRPTGGYRLREARGVDASTRHWALAGHKANRGTAKP
jgi:hypothetical protein